MTKDDDGLERLQQLMTADKKSMYFECPKYLVNGLIKQLAARDERIRELEQEIDTHAGECHPQIESLEQQLKAAQERLAEANGLIEECGSESFRWSIWYQRRKEYFAKHSPSSGKEQE